VLKRLFDLVVTSALLLLAAPVLLACALAVKLTSAGPVLFGHERCGRDGAVFRCLKFRTMVTDAEAWLDRDPDLKAHHQRNGFKLKRREDPRVTPVGHFLRYAHLDELPQLLNVLRGEMSLVGPRPVVTEELAWYRERAAELLSVRPGIFGPWTAQGRRRVDYPTRVDVELSYVEAEPSVPRDVKLLLRNVPVLIMGQVEEEEG
jgi:lipopolysaccharide/colanic/teichoic acid biosynthesis glycosyltransferase